MNQYDHLRKKLIDFKVEVDKDALWAKTSFAIPQKRKRRLLPIILLSAGLLIGAGYTITTILPAQRGNDNITDNHKPTPRGANSETSLSATFSAPKSNPESIKSPNEISSSPFQITKPAYQNAKDKLETRRHLIKKKSSLIYKLPSTVNSSLNNAESLNLKNRHTSNLPNANEYDLTNIQSGFSAANSEEENQHDHLPDVVQSISTNKIIKTKSQQTTITPAKTIPLSAISMTLIHLMPVEPPTQTPIFKNKKRLIIEMTQSLGFSILDIRLTSNDLKSIRDTWQPKMHVPEYLSTSLRGTMEIGHNIHLGTGLKYSQLTTQLQYKTSVSEKINRTGATTIIIDENGNTQSIAGSIGITRVTQIQSRRFSYHKMLDVTASLSYDVYHRKGLRINTELRGSMNLSNQTHGSTFNPENTVIAYTNKNTPISLRSPFSYGVGINSYMRVSPHWSLICNATYDQLLYEHHLFSNKLQFHHSMFSLGIGAAYIL